MANGKKKWVAFQGNLTIPAAMAGEEKDQKVQSGEPVQVPAFYADSVVQDGIAAHCDAPKKKPASKKADEPTDAEKAAAAKSAKFELAKDAVVDAQAALDAAEGTDAASDARATLLAAQQALAALQV
ncbi:hypothetical protein [Sulfitobacter pontiacus]|uniref:hypothetical protein n=1 Tax=Sulfitobacter pontiacus TaxID=60137 RepID=UPI0021A36CB9|nr:hypothetical protein [Sulfitobacter pontiacus]UWR20228.1 hypothetical protein K3755_07180 [Sulfitobacter pontiacus]